MACENIIISVIVIADGIDGKENEHGISGIASTRWLAPSDEWHGNGKLTDDGRLHAISTAEKYMRQMEDEYHIERMTVDVMAMPIDSEYGGMAYYDVWCYEN